MFVCITTSENPGLTAGSPETHTVHMTLYFSCSHTKKKLARAAICVFIVPENSYICELLLLLLYPGVCSRVKFQRQWMKPVSRLLESQMVVG